MNKVVAVILAHDEETHLPRTLKILNQFKREGLLQEIVVVNDGSTDKTAEIAQQAGATLVNHKENLGKGQGFISGALKAKELDGKILVLLDADILHFPRKTLLAMIKESAQNKAMVVPRQLESREKLNEKEIASLRQGSNSLLSNLDPMFKLALINQTGPRSFNMDLLNPLFKPKSILYKKWIKYLTTKIPPFTYISKKRMDTVSEELQASMKEAWRGARRWTLETALSKLIKRTIWIPQRIYHDSAFKKERTTSRRVSAEQAIAVRITERVQEARSRLARRIKLNRARRKF